MRDDRYMLHQTACQELTGRHDSFGGLWSKSHVNLEVQALSDLKGAILGKMLSFPVLAVDVGNGPISAGDGQIITFYGWRGSSGRRRHERSPWAGSP